MKIIIDAMGGDNAPLAFLEGGFRAARELGVEVVLVGRVEQLLGIMKEQGIETLPAGVELMDAEQVVDMHDDPATVVRTKKESSMVKGLRLLADGGGDAFVSAGSTGGLLSAATLVVKRVRGIRRAAFGPTIPTKTGSLILIDSGANVECSPEFLLQFGIMGSFYARLTLGLEKPRVALLNNGAEDSKGDPLHKESYQLLKEAGDKGVIHFIGNIEGREAMLGDCDVLVADGFSGNVFLKGAEGTAMFMGSLIKRTLLKNWKTKLAAALLKKDLKQSLSIMDYRRVGGTMLLGISKPVIKAHGSADTEAVVGAVKQAIAAVEGGICQAITDNVDKMILPREAQ
ncbi:MAG: phosphate acyltransferase PlsX [Oscillospiraceae bacterium]|nr:phosphate acyltransferase PlsX [Oscillospiraceae bacterium]MBR4194523.1 phosphate acyltransferase PlsX [Oscillospiraceae bacterium]